MLSLPARQGGLMAPSEAARHELYNALMPLLGPEPTETLMSHLLPNPSELHTMRTEMNERFDHLNDRMNERFDRMLLAQIGGFTVLLIAVFLN